MDLDQFSMARVADRSEILHRVYQFCRGADRLDLAIALQAFHIDASVHHGPYKGDPAGLLNGIAERQRTLPFSFHQVGNVLIEFSGPDDAMSEAYVLVWQSRPADGDGKNTEMLAASRYVDHFTRREGAWRIQNRTTIPGTTMTIPAASEGHMLFGPEWAKGSREDNDPSQVLRRQLGIT